MRTRKPFWKKLDNAGKLYPAILSSRYTTVFRLSVTLKAAVQVQILQDALNTTMKRFPYYNVHLRRGFFWYYFEENHKPLKLEADSPHPCMKLKVKKKQHHPFRIRAYRNRIAVEFSHVLTDGTGALIFLQHLCSEYLVLKEKLGRNILLQLPLQSEIAKEEWEDAFSKNHKTYMPSPRRKSRAYHFPFELENKGIYHLTTGIIPLLPLKKQCKNHGVSLSVYLTAVLMWSVQKHFMGDQSFYRQRGPLRIQIPVNLRNIFPSLTMSNFFLNIGPEIDCRLGEFTFEEILNHVEIAFRKETDPHYLLQQIAGNVRSEKQFLIRITPLFIKNFFLGKVYEFRGEGPFTTGLSNMGNVTMPEELNDYIERFEFFPPPSKLLKIKAAAISYQNCIYISFGKTFKEKEIERYFFTWFIKQGIPVKIETN